MYKIKLLNNISENGLSLFEADKYDVNLQNESPDAVLLRSYNMHEIELPSSLLAIGRAGAGVNNIPLEKCSQKGIVVFNTPGANANAVKELTIAGILLASRKIVQGISWVDTLNEKEDIGAIVEKGKNMFVGPEIAGKKIGVIGLGAIGVMVANAAHHLDMEVFGFDPYLSVANAWGVSRFVNKAPSIEFIFENCDYITLHIPQTKETKGFICEKTLNMMKDNVKIINFARDGLVNNTDLITALNSGKVAAYVTDFPCEELIGKKGVISIPHLGASTPESEENCAIMAVNEIKNFLENGDIRNSVNFPNVELPLSATTRITIIHKNIPNMLGQISSLLASENINIENMLNKSKDEIAYTIFDTNSDILESLKEKIHNINGVIRARVI